MKMKTYDSFDDYAADQKPGNKKIIEALRKFVKRAAPKLTEAVKWGNGCWLSNKEPVAYVYSAEDYVQFGFFMGSMLKDPKGLLEGAAKYVRHIKVRTPTDINERAFKALLKQATQISRDSAS